MNTSPSDVEHFDQILDYLRQTRAFDFAAYKRTSLMRRVLRRMQMVGVGTFEAYLDYIQLHQDEFAALFDTILINVTSFFRDEDVWRYLSSTVLPQLLSERGQQPLRVWSAGAASGQEAYTVVLALAELMGTDAVRERVKVYATDVDEQALSDARSGVYSLRAVENVPKHLLDKYFERSGSSYTIHRDLRRAVIFGRHDLVHDAPLSHIDLLMCRNTLMYFNAEAQARILARFYFSLNPGAYLVLGRAEMLFSHTAMFARFPRGAEAEPPRSAAPVRPDGT
jgi:two-component system CheB/CheR fusion protein